LARRLHLVVSTFAPGTRTRPELLWAAGLAVAAVLGGRLLGWIGAAGLVAAVGVVPIVGPRVAFRRREAQDRRRLPDRAAEIARAVRAGRSLPDAMARAAADDLPTAQRWCRLVDQVHLGRPFDDAVAAQEATVGEAERLVLAGLRIGALEGGAVGAATGALAARLRQEMELVDRRRVLTTQARTSAQVLAVLPLLFAAVMVAVRGPGAWLEPLGLVCVAAGGALELVGVVWMRRLLGTLR
jgi:Flp pilus assembly protein TadB